MRISLGNIYLLILFIGISFSANSQECKCSEAKVLKNKFIDYMELTKIDSARLILAKFKEMKSPDCESYYYTYSAFLALRDRKYTETKRFLNTSYEILKKNGCPDQAFHHFYNAYSSLYYDTDVLDSAIYYLVQGIKMTEQYGMKETSAMMYTTMANIFMKMNQMETCIEYLNKSIKIKREQSDYYYLSENYIVLSEAYATLGESNKNKVYYDSLKFAIDSAEHYMVLCGNVTALSRVFRSKAKSKLFERDYNSAQQYIDSSIKYSFRQADEVNLANYYLKKAEIGLITKNYDKALQWNDSAHKYAMFVKSLQSEVEVYKIKHQLFKAKGDFIGALSAHEYMTILSDSLKIIERSKTVNELEKKYNEVKNEKKIGELNQQTEIDSLRIRSLIGIIATVVLLLLVIVFFYRQSVTKNKLKTIETEQRLNRARMNPHFFFNAMASLQNLSMSDSKKELMPSFISKFSRIMRQSLESTFQEMDTIENEIMFLTDYLELQKLRSESRFSYSFNLDESIEPNEMLIPGMILQPFIENSIEHGFKNLKEEGRINLSFKLEEKQLTIVVTDNGQGFVNEEKHKAYPSRATQIIRDRLYLLNQQYKTNATFVISDLEKQGIKVEISLPVIYKT